MAINIAIMGFGTVGSGVAETLDINKELITKRVGEEINVKYILDIRDFVVCAKEFCADYDTTDCKHTNKHTAPFKRFECNF